MEFKFPDLGEGVTEGELRKWLVKVGDVVKKDQSIAEMETDKAIVEMPSPVAGRIAELLHEEGGTVRVGEVLAVIEEEPSEEKAPLEEMPAEEGSVSVVGELPVGEELAAARPATDKVLATPAVRRLAREMKIDITKIKGPGRTAASPRMTCAPSRPSRRRGWPRPCSRSSTSTDGWTGCRSRGSAEARHGT